MKKQKCAQGFTPYSFLKGTPILSQFPYYHSQSRDSTSSGKILKIRKHSGYVFPICVTSYYKATLLQYYSITVLVNISHLVLLSTIRLPNTQRYRSTTYNRDTVTLDNVSLLLQNPILWLNVNKMQHYTKCPQPAGAWGTAGYRANSPDQNPSCTNKHKMKDRSVAEQNYF